ncbi:hypothetical protein LAJ19_19895 (plasmid) [Deinococcus taeanensis]|uniref:hypothetical protein n=1 Tax=Deinococcus taeanensis TaxID=2737050 RepID=UPI001CDC1724|nr:hypothetical protein [Deinococcus taeanensis]UBV45397.1 hypothetical protein LAJ19_19895 [Deinococcus taeanensis]
MNDRPDAPLHPVYLLKVITGLSVLGALVLIAQSIDLLGLALFHQRLLLALLVSLALATVPFTRLVYRQTDELEQILHQNASVNSLVIVASASTVLGILQAGHLLPVFTQFWTLGLIVATWGIQLMLADRHYR